MASIILTVLACSLAYHLLADIPYIRVSVFRPLTVEYHYMTAIAALAALVVITENDVPRLQLRLQSLERLVVHISYGHLVVRAVDLARAVSFAVHPYILTAFEITYSLKYAPDIGYTSPCRL